MSCYLEFKITIKQRSKGKSHLFIGLVDKSKYKKENLVSTFWKDSPSSYYWDVWNNKLIKTNEYGAQISNIGPYGCQCEESETKIGMLYCSITRSVSFIKDDINQGVAFKNIPTGLNPSLDIWFEIGTIDIILAKYKEKTYL